jgi:prolyl oligopeptidase
MHARKMAARLQAAAVSTKNPATKNAGSNKAGANPILLWVESRAGHGAGKPLGKVIAQLVDEWSFVFLELGVAYHGQP